MAAAVVTPVVVSIIVVVVLRRCSSFLSSVRLFLAALAGAAPSEVPVLEEPYLRWFRERIEHRFSALCLSHKLRGVDSTM